RERSEWQPSDNHLYVDLIPGCSRNARGGVPDGRDPRPRPDPKIMERLKERSHLNGRSLRQEVKALLERAAETFTVREARRVSGRWRQNADRVGDPPIGWLDRARAGPGWLGHR